MQVLLHANGLELESGFRAEVTEKIELSFARFSDQIGKIDAYLTDLNGPKKGVDKCIRLVIDVKHEPMIVVEERGEDWSAILENVFDRATQTVTKKIKRARSRNNRTSMAGDREAFDAVPIPEINDWNPLQNQRHLGLDA